ncbi:hypothetical protein O181_054084 [Austropuccinia psidii MF-1]|uniref:Integrase catalytic domain-containing protein n=1 Tax=Austropuccinia psidii MF-1 TaxID=1389203 RepID=A0A9Q3E3X4_9BASI|nr:hypothetical protein [Austropuccinia psidii MF-1]
MLYDTKPFNLDTIRDRVAIEHSCRQSTHQHALLFDKNKQAESSKTKVKSQSENNSKKKKVKNNNQPLSSNTQQGEDTSKRLDKIEQLLERLQNSGNLPSLNAASDSKELSQPLGSDSEAFIFEEVNAMMGHQRQDLIYLDSGAERTIVNNLLLLEDPTPVKKQINTFSTLVKVAHQGTLLLNGVRLYPVYYVPNGPANLLSVSQICDQGNLFATKLTDRPIYSLPTTDLDWHMTLCHPSDSYIKVLLNEGRIDGRFTCASDCQVCQQAKIKNHPHSQSLPRADAPFFKLHMDTLSINPPTHKGFKYVLVLVDDHSRFNRIYAMSEKSQADDFIMLFIMEIKNKLNIVPAYLHTDRGGEFSSSLFLKHLKDHSISLERGPPESPQTNGVAERFNQTLLSKIRCLLGQSKIPSSYWDEAALHASLLLNALPHKHLNMRSPMAVLQDKKCLIEPITRYERLVPFGVKVTTKILNPSSK